MATDLQQVKRTWPAGPITATNNHRVHQLKILLMLDRELNDPDALSADQLAARRLSIININPVTGETLDYRQRSALYYHNYDLQSWIEISLLGNCCQPIVRKAFNFLVQHVRSGEINHEFAHSTAAIDRERAAGGFPNAIADSTFDVSRMTPTIVAMYTLNANKNTSDQTKSSNIQKCQRGMHFTS